MYECMDEKINDLNVHKSIIPALDMKLSLINSVFSTFYTLN